jgi:hypothetical protein
VQFVGIAIDQPDKIDAFAAELQLNYPALVGGYGAIELSKAMGNRLGALPFTVIVESRGTVAHTQLGPLKDAQLRSILGQLLEFLRSCGCLTSLHGRAGVVGGQIDGRRKRTRQRSRVAIRPMDCAHLARSLDN